MSFESRREQPPLAVLSSKPLQQFEGFAAPRRATARERELPVLEAACAASCIKALLRRASRRRQVTDGTISLSARGAQCHDLPTARRETMVPAPQHSSLRHPPFSALSPFPRLRASSPTDTPLDIDAPALNAAIGDGIFFISPTSIIAIHDASIVPAPALPIVTAPPPLLSASTFGALAVCMAPRCQRGRQCVFIIGARSSSIARTGGRSAGTPSRGQRVVLVARVDGAGGRSTETPAPARRRVRTPLALAFSACRVLQCAAL